MMDKEKAKEIEGLLRKDVVNLDIEKYKGIFNSYDLRGEYNSEIDEVFSFLIGLSLGEFLKKKGLNVVVGYDTRISSNHIKYPFMLALMKKGYKVYDVGISTTDKVAVVGKHLKCASVMITASHHPYTRSGFKFMYVEGNGFSNEDMGKIKEIFKRVYYDRSYEKYIDFGNMEGKYVEYFKESDTIYVDKFISSLKEYIRDYDYKVEMLKNRGFGFVVDACNGGCSFLARKVFDKIGVKANYINSDGILDMNINPNPKKDTRDYVLNKIKEYGSECAVGYDVDADRVFFVHKDYGWVDGQRLFVILSKILKSRKIVCSLDTSKMLELNTSADIYYTRVGDIFVSKKALEVGADFCGEPNGHYAFPKFSLYNSGLFASAILVLNYFEISDIIRDIKELEFREKNIKFENNAAKKEAMNSIKEYVKKNKDVVVVSEEDGVKFEIYNVSVLIRPSGTKPVIRITYESENVKNMDLFEREFLGNIVN